MKCAWCGRIGDVNPPEEDPFVQEGIYDHGIPLCAECTEERRDDV